MPAFWNSNSFEDSYWKTKVNAHETCSSHVFFVWLMPLVIVWSYTGVHIMFVVPFKFWTPDFYTFVSPWVCEEHEHWRRTLSFYIVCTPTNSVRFFWLCCFDMIPCYGTVFCHNVHWSVDFVFSLYLPPHSQGPYSVVWTISLSSACNASSLTWNAFRSSYPTDGWDLYLSGF